MVKIGLFLLKKEKLEDPEKKPQSKGEDEQQIKAICGALLGNPIQDHRDDRPSLIKKFLCILTLLPIMNKHVKEGPL